MTDYTSLCEQARALADIATWDITVMANISALLFQSMSEINWAGFYLIRDEKLILGPFQGKPACTDFPLKKGVCATAVLENRIVRVDDVHTFPGHIACDSDSASEIVLPIRKDGYIIGVLDIDSPVCNRFTQEDETGLLQIVGIVEEKLA